MQTVETLNEGLKRAFRITIPARDIDARVDLELKTVAPQVRMPGFRPGKVPANLIRKMHGASLQAQALQEAVQDGVQQLLSEQRIRPAMQPAVALEEGGDQGKDAVVTVEVEALPDVPEAKTEGLKIERLTVERHRRGDRPGGDAPRRRPEELRSRPGQACGGDGRSRRHGLRGQGRRRAVRGRQGRGHVGRARLGPADPGLRGPAGRRQGERGADRQRHLPGRLQCRLSEGARRDLRRARSTRSRRPRR